MQAARNGISIPIDIAGNASHTENPLVMKFIRQMMNPSFSPHSCLNAVPIAATTKSAPGQTNAPAGTHSDGPSNCPT